MKSWTLNLKNNRNILALGAESSGNFSLYNQNKVYLSDDFGDLLEEKNFQRFQRTVLDFIEKNGEPDIVISDLHPLFNTTSWGKELASKFNADFVQVQHHLAHIFSSVGEFVAQGHGFPKDFIGIACDGTGYGLDEKIWGGEIFELSNGEQKRFGKLENQTLIGGELAIKEPARMLISTLGKFLEKDEVYGFVKEYYDKNQFELLWNQYKEEFNCLETSSTGRVLDAVSVLLGFSGNERAYKHAPIDNLEKGSSEPYGIEPEIKKFNGIFEFQTTSLFKYLIKNLDKDKKRLAGTAQMYLAKGLWEICRKKGDNKQVFFAGGVANNKIISDYLVSKGVIVSQEVPRGDAGISFGQLIYYLANAGD